MQFVGHDGGDLWVRFGSLGCKVMILFYFIFSASGGDEVVGLVVVGNGNCCLVGLW